MGIRTPWVDALTFGLGSGIAGIAGVALSQIDNVSPNLGQGYIIDSFMVVVFGGVGNLWGTLVGAFIARHRQQVPRALRRRRARQDPRPRLHHPLHPEAAARPVRAEGQGGRGMIGRFLAGGLDRTALIVIAILVAVAIARSGAQPVRRPDERLPRPDLRRPARRQVPDLRAARALRRPDLGLSAASSRSATAPSSPSAATPWACT